MPASFSVSTALMVMLLAVSPAAAAPLIVGRELSAYDVIVAGGGVGGIITATRLAEAGKKVILLERGPGSTYKSGGNVTVPWNSTVTAVDVPALVSSVSTSMPWAKCTDVLGATAGCLLGGSGSINSLMWVVPHSTDFEKWPVGWNYQDLLASGAVARLTERNPGQTHPSPNHQLYDQALSGVLQKLLNDNGYYEVDAISNPYEKQGVWSNPPNNIKNSLRAGPAATYLPAALANPNFSLMLHAKVVRIIRSGNATVGSTATGVEFEDQNGHRNTISLREGGKIVLGAGTMSTPRILFNSGIGPKDQIQVVQGGTTNITLPAESDWIELPVGKNLRDHPIVRITYDTVAPANFNAYNFTGSFANPNITDATLYNEKGEGVFAQCVQRNVFWQTAKGSDGGLRYTQSTVEYSANNAFVILHYLTHGATSTGSMGILANGSTYEIQKPCYRTEGDLTSGASFLDQFRGIVKGTKGLITESAATINRTSLDLANSTWTSGAHYLSTTMMGKENNGSYVTDLNTRVYGTKNIYVVDGSFHPDLPIGNTQAIIALASEHAWTKILADNPDCDS